MAKEVPIQIPEPMKDINGWIVFGLDPSLRCTGYALMKVLPGQESGTVATWVKAGSTKPDDIDNGLHPDRTIWIRTKVQALYLRNMVEAQVREWQAAGIDTRNMGIILSLEAPPPQNDYLASIHRAIHTVLFETSFLADNFKTVRILYINASTLRSMMHLTMRGAKNKAENIARAYNFIDKSLFPELDPDSCDAVLTGMIARYVASVMMGFHREVPTNILNSLCNATPEVKGKGTRLRTVIKGIFHRSEYWYMYARGMYKVGVKDAAIPKKIRARVEFSI